MGISAAHRNILVGLRNLPLFSMFLVQTRPTTITIPFLSRFLGHGTFEIAESKMGAKVS